MCPSRNSPRSSGKFENPEDSELERDYKEWCRRAEKIERKIDRLYSLELIVLERAGADRKSLIRLLSATALGSPSKVWKDFVRNRMNALQSLGRRMETLIEHHACPN